MPSKKAAKKAKKRQKQKAKRKEKQEAMELEEKQEEMELDREMDEWAQTTYDQLLQEVFLDQGISREEVWGIIQEAKKERKKDIRLIRAVEKMRLAVLEAQLLKAQLIQATLNDGWSKAELFQAACNEIKKITHLQSPESMATLQHLFSGDGERIVKADNGEGLFFFF